MALEKEIRFVNVVVMMVITLIIENFNSLKLCIIGP